MLSSQTTVLVSAVGNGKWEMGHHRFRHKHRATSLGLQWEAFSRVPQDDGSPTDANRSYLVWNLL